MISISEIDIPHVFFIEEHIWIKSIIVPEVMEIILSLYPPINHVDHPPGKSEENVSVEDRSEQVEIRINWAQKLVVWMVPEPTVGNQVRECLMESH